jgi:hypothetical protein
VEAKAAGEIASVIMELRRFTTPRKTPPAGDITALTVTTPATGSPPAPVTDGEQHGLLDALSKVPAPRDRRGVRNPLCGLRRLHPRGFRPQCGG